jgi:tripartite ATP-independent transporter DctP family solute receptor
MSGFAFAHRRMVRPLLGAAAVLLAGAVTGGGALAQDSFTLKYATSLGKESAYYKGAVALAQAAEELSKGRLKIQIFPDAQLGNDRDMIEGMQLGSIDLASPSTGAMGAVVPAATVLDLPYIFDDLAHAYRVLDGPIGGRIAKLFDGKGFHPLGYWEIGFRHLTNKHRPVSTPADVKGLKLRTLPSEIHQKAWSLVGAQPVALDWTEVYNSLSTGVVDGQENPFNIIILGKLHEVQKHLSLTGHVYGTAPTSVSDITWGKLPPDLREALREAVRRSAGVQRQAASGNEAAQLEQLKKAGMAVIEKPDRAAFQAAMRPAWDLYVGRFGKDGQALIDAIRGEASGK